MEESQENLDSETQSDLWGLTHRSHKRVDVVVLRWSDSLGTVHRGAAEVKPLRFRTCTQNMTNVHFRFDWM